MNNSWGTLAFGTVSGGAGASLTGGNFWQGAVTGLVVSGLNHLMHQNEHGDPKGRKAPTLEEANKHYREANGKPMTVDASTIDLNFVDTTGWVEGNKYEVSTLLSSKHGRVFGKLNLVYKGNNQVAIESNMYDFDIVRVGCGGACCLVSNPKLVGRNIATWMGDVYAGKGTPYMINFNGINTIRNGTSVLNTYSQTSHGFRF
ncbi:MAG: hypothetical protein M0D53_16850 [Flavobacterium sp. JAD_PAG50586_2]|nr:MAG: hypothetical protein M0D53_16850 [Flavobacterium sp. JAD_PAG50586_2]